MSIKGTFIPNAPWLTILFHDVNFFINYEQSINTLFGVQRRIFHKIASSMNVDFLNLFFLLKLFVHCLLLGVKRIMSGKNRGGRKHRVHCFEISSPILPKTVTGRNRQIPTDTQSNKKYIIINKKVKNSIFEWSVGRITKFTVLSF